MTELHRQGAASLAALQNLDTVRHVGRVVRACGTSLHVSGLRARIGQRCRIHDRLSSHVVHADVIGFSDGLAILFPLDRLGGIAVDAEVTVVDDEVRVPVSDGLCGRVLDGLGRPLDQKALPADCRWMPLDTDAPNALQRAPVRDVMATGIRVVDALLTVGKGQRLGIFAMAGGGKSSLLAMLARHAGADVIVLAMIGERGREVREFIDDVLGEAGFARTVVIAATADRPALERVHAARSATAIAEAYRRQGKSVLLLMDSVTRYARALREIGLSAGEPAVRRGYPPSVFAELPRFFERAGNDDRGSITAFYTVLAEDEDNLDPIAEETRSLLDGHIVLSRALGEKGHYPAIDVLGSTSRVFAQVTSDGHQALARHCRELLARYREIEFLLQVGEYREGNDELADKAVRLAGPLNRFLQQAIDEREDPQTMLERLSELLA